MDSLAEAARVGGEAGVPAAGGSRHHLGLRLRQALCRIAAQHKLHAVLFHKALVLRRLVVEQARYVKDPTPSLPHPPSPLTLTRAGSEGAELPQT